jgi:quinolinate synthase
MTTTISVKTEESKSAEITTKYLAIGEEEAMCRIREIKDELGEKLLILGHHYQQDSVIQFADISGDSYGLATRAAQIDRAEYIVFCGVHFMAESADILTPPDKVVILPDMRAGCTMADMADLEQVEIAWEEISACTQDRVIPVTYINSAASLKDFVGRNGGAVCTSTNARRIIEWAFLEGKKLFFFPDEHLGRNTCAQMGVSLDKMIVWNPDQLNGGHHSEEVDDATVLLWQGHCSVHMGFTPQQVDHWRKQRPKIKIIVHPECTYDVVRASDYSGSTAYIIDEIRAAEPGSEWAIGTEIHLVNRLKEEMPDRFITSLSPFQCLCATMYRIRPQYLLWILENLVEGRIVNQVSVAGDIAEGARIALSRMIEITSR